MRRFSLALAAALLAVLIAAPAALAVVNYKGKTTQGNDFNLRTDDAGIAERTSYGWDMNCSGGGSLTNGGTVSRFPNANAAGFESAGKYEAPIENKFVGRFKVKIEGERVSDTRFRGSFKVKAKIFKKSSGEQLTKCSTGIVRWTADVIAPPATPRAARSGGELSLR